MISYESLPIGHWRAENVIPALSRTLPELYRRDSGELQLRIKCRGIEFFNAVVALYCKIKNLLPFGFETEDHKV